MFGKLSNSSIRPVAMGMPVQSSTYGQVIPVYMGRTKGALYLTWEANIRQSGSKLKKKKNVNQYAANVDFLVGHNPILTPLQFWANQSQRFPLNFTKVSGSGSSPFPFYYTDFTISDPNFYAVVAVTLTQNYGPITFNDYGNPNGPTTIPAGTWEVPLWNAAYHGPDPGLPSIFRGGFNPYYIWTPSMGNVVRLAGASGTINVYYAQLFPDGSSQYGKKQSGTDIPAGALHLTFEPILGDGPEYTGNDSQSGQPLSAQKILYPCYAGLGSGDFQTGQTGLPQVSAEFLAAYAINPEGDADFADMIEDIFKQGLSQPGYATASDPPDLQNSNIHLMQRGLACYDWPGMVQATSIVELEAWNPPLTYWQANQAGNILIGVVDGGVAPGTLAISDDAVNAWNLISSPGARGACWYAIANAALPGNQVTFGGMSYDWFGAIFELGGVDTFDAAANATNGSRSVSIATTNASGTPGYLFAFVDFGFETHFPPPASADNIPVWTLLQNAGRYLVYSRTVYQPGEYTFTSPGDAAVITLAAFKCADPPSYPKPLGNILDDASMQLTRAQCKAAGLWGSLVMDSQQKASDWLEKLYKAANAAPVWSGFKLKSIPYSEASAAGNGAIYNAPTAAGPTLLKISDFIRESDDQPLYQIKRKAQVDVPNSKQIQHPNRAGDYNDTVVSQPLTAAIALFGSRKDSPDDMRMIQDPAVARMILNIEVNKENLRNTITFKLNASRNLLEPMDLVTIPADPLTGIPAIDVRLTEAEEDDAFALSCEAEPFVYGTYSPVALPVTSVQPYQLQGGATAGDVNAPVIFEPVPLLTGSNQGQIWLVVSAAPGQMIQAVVADGGAGYSPGDVLDVVEAGALGGQVTVSSVSAGVITGVTVLAAGKNYAVGTNLPTTGGAGTGATINITQISAGYGGCLVYLSTDGGSSYNPIGQIFGNGVTGVSTADWPAAADPDTTNNLLLDLSESAGTLNSYQVADEDSFTYPCYIEGGGIYSIPYELMTYAIATLTGTSQYTLEATGGNHLRRGVYGAPNPLTGVDHPSASRFAFLGLPTIAQPQGMFKMNLDPSWIGKTLWFKFASVNSSGAGAQSPADLTAYPFTPTGLGAINPGAAPFEGFLVNGL
jgi:hypothetical protein